MLVHFLLLAIGTIKAPGFRDLPRDLKWGAAAARRVSAPARRPLQIPGKTPRRRFQPGGGRIPTLSGRTPALRARCAYRVRPASGSITQRGIPPERGAAGLGHEGGRRKLPPREAGWWAVWEAASEGDRRRMTARRPNTDETGGDHAGAGELEPGLLGQGRKGNGGRAAAPWPGGRGKAPGVLRLSDVSYCVLNLTLPLKNIPKLVPQDSGLLWLLFLILSPLSLYLFISPSPVIFVLCLTAPCRPPFLSVRLPVPVSPHLCLPQVLSVSPCPPLFPSPVSPFFLNLFISVEESGFLSALPFPCLWFGPLSPCLCVCFSRRFLGLSLPVYLSLVSLSLPFFPVSVSHYLWPLLAPKDRIFQSQDPKGIGVWP